MRSIKFPSAPPNTKANANICADKLAAIRKIHIMMAMLTNALNPEKNQVCQLPVSDKKLNAEPELNRSVQDNIGKTGKDA